MPTSFITSDVPGLNFRDGMICDEFNECVNFSHVDEHCLRRRPGFTPYSTTQWRTGVSFNGYLLVADVDNTAFKNINLANGTAAANTSSPTNAAVGTLVPFGGRVYYVDGTMAKVFETPTGTYRQAGITAPSVAITPPTPAAGGEMTEGDHLFRYRYLNSSTGYISNASAAVTITVTAGQKVTFTVGTNVTASGDAQVDKIILEATPANAATFYRVGTCNNTAAATVVMDLSDANLLYKTPSSLYGDDGHAEMPAFDHLVEHRGRLFGVKGTLLGWSRGDQPESFDMTQYARKLATVETTDTVTGLVSFSGDLYICTARSITRFTYVDDPALGSFNKCPSILGLWNPRCLTTVEGHVFGFGPYGVWRLSALNPVLISSNMDPYLESSLDKTYASKFFSFYDKKDRSVSFAFTATGDTDPHDMITVSTRAAGKWQTREYDHAVIACVQAYGEAYLATSNAKTWKMDPAAFDGVATGITAFTTTTGSTTTAIKLTTSPSAALVGTYLRIGSETRLISNITTNTVTTAAFSAAPAAGVTAQACTVEMRLTPGWERVAQVGARARNAYLACTFEPIVGGTFQMEVLLDFSATPITWQRDLGDTPPSGITYANNATAVTGTFSTKPDGYFPIPMPSLTARTVTPRFVMHDLYTGKFGMLEMVFVNWNEAKAAPGVGE